MAGNSFLRYEPEGIYVLERSGMNLRLVGDLHLYTPRASEELRFRALLESELRRTKGPGCYRGKEANQIIRVLFETTLAEFNRLFPQIAGRSFYEFLVFMHSQWGRLMKKAQQGVLQNEESSLYWKEGPTERRTLRYLLEECVRSSSHVDLRIPESEFLSLLDRVYIGARHLIELSNISDQIHFFYPDQAVLTILPPRQEKYFEYSLDPSAQAAFERLQQIKVEHHTFSGVELEDFEDVWKCVAQHLNEPFEREFGVSIERACGCCLGLKEFTSPAKDSFDVRFIPEDGVISAIAGNYSLNEVSVRRVIAGLTLTKECLDTENRKIFDTKRHFQSRFRPFARLPHSSGYHLAWDTFALEEIIPEMIGNMSFCKLPREWEVEDVRRAVGDVNQSLSKLFLQRASHRFKKVGWQCITEVKRLSDGNKVGTNISHDPGEIDIIALSPDGDIVAHVECKRLSPSTDTRTFRDDLSDFYGDQGFFAKVQRKQLWLSENQSLVANHLRINGMSVGAAITIRPLVLTLFPSFAMIKTGEVPIVSAKVFFERLAKNRRFWPMTEH